MRRVLGVIKILGGITFIILAVTFLKMNTSYDQDAEFIQTTKVLGVETGATIVTGEQLNAQDKQYKPWISVGFGLFGVAVLTWGWKDLFHKREV